MKIAVIGIGYVGLSNAILLAQEYNVYCVDILPEKVALLNNKKSSIIDAEISSYLAKNNLFITATQNLNLAVAEADYVIIAVPTNYDANTNQFDTSIIEETIKNILAINRTATIIIKSTIPIGFTDKIIKATGYENIAFCPEFLREGKALYDNLYPSRIIIGFNHTNKCLANNINIFIELIKNCIINKNTPILLTGTKEAEAIKLFSNTYLALRVAYFNELDTYAETNLLNTKDIITGVCLDPRIGTFYNNPSFGYGGYCLPKDTKQLLTEYASVPQDIIKSIVKSNDTRINYIANQISNKLVSLDNPTLGVYRLAMKTGSDNFRESSIIKVLQKLSTNINIIIYEPTIPSSSFEGWAVEKSLEEFKQKASIIITNRFDKLLEDVKDKIYTRDIFNNN